MEHVPIARVTNLSQTLDKLKAKGFWTFGTDMNGTPSHRWNTSGKLALIIGNEGKGISANIKKQVDEMITIPMNGHVQSLKMCIRDRSNSGAISFDFGTNGRNSNH